MSYHNAVDCHAKLLIVSTNLQIVDNNDAFQPKLERAMTALPSKQMHVVLLFVSNSRCCV